MKKYIMVFWQIYSGFLLIFFAYSESATSKMYKIKKKIVKFGQVSAKLYTI